jgi:hypothetical protein
MKCGKEIKGFVKSVKRNSSKRSPFAQISTSLPRFLTQPEIENFLLEHKQKDENQRLEQFHGRLFSRFGAFGLDKTLLIYYAI